MLQICNTLKILEVFFNEPTKKHELLEISRKSSLAHTSVKNILKILIKEKLILENVEKKGKRRFPQYFSNIAYPDFIQEKKLSNLRKIYSSEIIRFLEDSFMPNSIIIFGSYAKGEDIEESDIDLFVESSEGEVDLTKFERKIGKKINLLFSNSLKQLNKNLKENILNGVLLQGEITL